MKLRLFLSLFLLLQAPFAQSQGAPVVVRLTVPEPITLFTGWPYNAPLRIRAVRVDNGQPAEGVNVSVFANRLICFEGLDCGAYDLLEAYGYFEGLGGPTSAESRGVDLVTDSRGEATLPRLIGGSTPLKYTFAFFVLTQNSVYRHEGFYSVLQVNQVSLRHTIPATNPLALGVLLLAVLGCAVRLRRT